MNFTYVVVLSLSFYIKFNIYLCLYVYCELQQSYVTFNEYAVHGLVIEEHVLKANIEPHSGHCKW